MCPRTIRTRNNWIIYTVPELLNTHTIADQKPNETNRGIKKHEDNREVRRATKVNRKWRQRDRHKKGVEA